MWVTIAEAILGILATLALLAEIFSPLARKRLGYFLAGFVGAALDVAAPVLVDVSATLVTVEKAFLKAIQQHGGTIKTDLKKPFEDLAKAALDHVTGELLKKGHIRPEDANALAATAVADAFGFGMSSFAVTMAFEAAFPEKLNTLNGIGPMLATMAGFAEIMKHALGPVMEAGIGVPQHAEANRKFRSKPPSGREVAEWHSRRLLDPKDLELGIAWSGLMPEYSKALVDSAYRPPSAFLLARVIDDTNADVEPVRKFLEFAGIRDADIDELIKAFELTALKTLRQKALTAEITRYVDGLMDDTELDASLDDFKLNDEAKRLIKIEAGDTRLAKLTADFKKAWDVKLEAGVIGMADYQVAISGLGYVDPIRGALIGIEDAKLAAQVAKDEAAAIKASVRQAQAAATLAAMTAYKKGEISLDQITVALLGIGLTPAVVAALVALARARGQTLPKPPKPPKPKPAPKPAPTSA